MGSVIFIVGQVKTIDERAPAGLHAVAEPGAALLAVGVVVVLFDGVDGGVTRSAASSGGHPRLRSQVTQPVRSWCGDRLDGHLLASTTRVQSQDSRSFPCR